MDPTFDDRLTGLIRNSQRNALELVQFVGELAARSGTNENQVHQVIQQCFAIAQQSQPQAAWQTQPTYSQSNR